MTAYLRAHKPAIRQFRSPRRATVSGVIAVHTAENTPDFVAFDGGAEAVTSFIVGRTTHGSYHDLVDSDSAVHLVDWSDEAFHDGTGTNPHSLSISIATRADVWPWAPADWRAGAIEQAAKAAARQARWVKATTGIVVPARRITAAQARSRVPGFVTHAELDPGRRSDPGAGFPWEAFLTRFAQLTEAAPQEDLFMLDTHEARDAYVRNTYRKLRGKDGTDAEVGFWVWVIAADRANALNLIIDLTVEARRAS